jgi:hypothetical protein
MTGEVQAPRELIESVADMRFPAKTDARLTWLMNRNTNGQLSVTEREELESLVELSERMSLVRAEALRVLGRSPV